MSFKTSSYSLSDFRAWTWAWQPHSFLQIGIQAWPLLHVSNDPSDLFHYLRELSHPKSSLYPIIHKSQPVDSHIKASLFNMYFNYQWFHPPTYRQAPISNRPVELYCHWCIRCVRGNLISKPFESSGIDDINPAILKICADPSYYNSLIFYTDVLTHFLYWQNHSNP